MSLFEGISPDEFEPGLLKELYQDDRFKRGIINFGKEHSQAKLNYILHYQAELNSSVLIIHLGKETFTGK